MFDLLGTMKELTIASSICFGTCMFSLIILVVGIILGSWEDDYDFPIRRTLCILVCIVIVVSFLGLIGISVASDIISVARSK